MNEVLMFSAKNILLPGISTCFRSYMKNRQGSRVHEL